MQFAINFDVDWANDEVMEDTLRLVDEYNIKATFFATHHTPTLKNTNLI